MIRSCCRCRCCCRRVVDMLVPPNHGTWSDDGPWGNTSRATTPIVWSGTSHHSIVSVVGSSQRPWWEQRPWLWLLLWLWWLLLWLWWQWLGWWFSATRRPAQPRRLVPVKWWWWSGPRHARRIWRCPTGLSFVKQKEKENPTGKRLTPRSCHGTNQPLVPKR